MACNCSICSKKAHLLAFAPDSNFTLLSGDEVLKSYQFRKKNIHHSFCSECGIGTFGTGTGKDGVKMRAINVRCLDDIDVSKFPVTHVDGKSF
ncbi:MAG TPA: GFA family protein [Pseudobdellovibrionaceae bacterium]|nr:GFA family protein [Pseudobdellovibrionaceae bacterium]